MWHMLDVDIISKDASRLKRVQVQTIPLRTSPSLHVPNQVPSAQCIPNCRLKCGPHLKHAYVNMQLTAPAFSDWMAQCPPRNKYALVENILVQMSVVLWTAFPATHVRTSFTLLCASTPSCGTTLCEKLVWEGTLVSDKSKYFISNS